MKQESSWILFNYWNEIRGSRAAPHRLEIEPARIAAILPETFILERSGGNCYRYRLAGTRICEQFGTELRGQNFIESWDGDDRAVLLAKLGLIVSEAAVAVLEFEAASSLEKFARFETILVPLTQTGARVDRILGAISPIDPPGWLTLERLGTRRLLRHDLIWTEKAEALASGGSFPAGSIAQQRAARLVNVARRQFRVYEGGLTDPARPGLRSGSKI